VPGGLARQLANLKAKRAAAVFRVRVRVRFLGPGLRSQPEASIRVPGVWPDRGTLAAVMLTSPPPVSNGKGRVSTERFAQPWQGFNITLFLKEKTSSDLKSSLRQPFPVLLLCSCSCSCRLASLSVCLEEVLGAVVALFNELFGTFQQVNLGESRTSREGFGWS